MSLNIVKQISAFCALYVMRPSVFIKTTNPLYGLDAEKQLKKCFSPHFYQKSKMADFIVVDMFIIIGLRRSFWCIINGVHLVCELNKSLWDTDKLQQPFCTWNNATLGVKLKFHAQYVMRPLLFINTTNHLDGLYAEKQLKKVVFCPFFQNPRWPP